MAIHSRAIRSMAIAKHFRTLLGAAAVVAGMTAMAREPVESTGASPTGAPAGSLAITALRTEHASNPLGIDARRPCLGWEMAATARGARQTAYRLQVALSAADLSDG